MKFCFTLPLSILFAFVSVSASFSAESQAFPFKGWTPSGSDRQTSPVVLELVGDGKSSSNWQSKPIPVKPGEFYRFDVSFRSSDTDQGCLPCGIGPIGRDYRPKKGAWTDESFCFRMNDGVSEVPLRVGQWESKGTYQYRNVTLTPIVPVMKGFEFPSDGKKATLVLGDDETITKGVYRFSGRFGGNNIHRPLEFSNATFNSMRWCFGNESQVVYRFNLQPRIDGSPKESIPFDEGAVRVGVCYYAGSEPGIVEVSRDGQTRWTEIGKLDKTGVHDFIVPQIAFPLSELFLRIRGVSDSNFQVDAVDLKAALAERYGALDVKELNAVGETIPATYTDAAPTGTDATEKQVELVLTSGGGIRVSESSPGTELREHLISLTHSASPGKREQQFRVGDRTYTITVETHPLHRHDYGYFVDSSEAASLWWAEADWKISRTRPAPEKSDVKPIEIQAAKNDTEAFQFVVRAPDGKAIRGLTGTLTELKGPGGATIPVEKIELLYAYYHFVSIRTDGTGLIDFWPDALPPLDKPIDIEAGRNQPIWINVKVPADAVAGEYRGFFRLRSADGSFDRETPYAVRVWDFSLPEENHLDTAYGFSPELAARYHNAKTEEDRRRVLESYLQCFADHRLSIYNPAPYDPIVVKWLPDEKEGEKSRCEIDFSRYEAEMSRVLAKFHFTNFTVPGHGLGGGTFQSRSGPSIGKYGPDTPQYKAMMADYYAKLVGFLKEKHWLDKSYVYWFDEPGKHDYDFVAEGLKRLRHYAPGLPRMMTLMMRDRAFFDAMEKIGVTLDIWCPVSSSYDEELAKERMEKGERFWWYVCTGPKAPYCTLFIDHPATELRIWHWQAWQRGIVGSLIWQSNYWNSPPNYPNGFQNPYDDPMGYSGENTYWGNGDGRFLYPPLAAAVPGLNEDKPMFEKPVSSIRLAMLREGVEDYEMFHLLRELLKTKGATLADVDRKAAESLLVVPDSVTKSMTEFTIDPRPLLDRRRAVGAMIETLIGR